MSTCHFCPAELPARAINGNTWTGTEYIRVDLCRDCFRAGRLTSAPRRPRRPRQPRQLTELSMAFQLGAMSQGKRIEHGE